MGLITTIETRSNSPADPHFWINTLLESSNYATKSGTVITPETALRVSVVHACVAILSETIASLPLLVIRKLETGGNEPVTSHALYPIFHDSWNPLQDTFEARDMGVGHLKLRGNWYNRIEWDGRGRIVALWPMHPRAMQVVRAKGEVWYQYAPDGDVDEFGTPRGTYPANQIWHVKDFRTDGLAAKSIVTSYARESIGLAVAMEDFAATFFGNGAVPGSVLKHPGQLGPEAAGNLKASLDAYSREQRHKTLVLEEGMDWTTVGVNNRDAQFSELSASVIRSIARYFRVPLLLLAEPDKTSTYAAAEQFFLSFARNTIWPITSRIEASAKHALLTPAERRLGYDIKFNLKALQEADFTTRMNGYRVGRDGGWLSVNDIRQLEDMPPIPNGNIYLQPANFIEAGKEPEPEPQPSDEPAPEGDDNE